MKNSKHLLDEAEIGDAYEKDETLEYQTKIKKEYKL